MWRESKRAESQGGSPDHGTVLLLEAVHPWLHWSPSICFSQDAIWFQLANIWSTILRS